MLRYYRVMDHPTEETALAPADHQSERLWTPWRMRYVRGAEREPGCVFCNRLAGEDDVASLILHREADVFVIMNLFPYNTGHLMLVPTAHVASPDVATEATMARMGSLIRPALRALRQVLGCQGFNIGINVGDVAGAGMADHLHQHIVPRWTGDANFMPILAGTMVMPELLPATYAKTRAELKRTLLPVDHPGRDEIRALVLTTAGDMLVEQTDSGLRLPRFEAAPDEALWQAAVRGLTGHALELEIDGWAGKSFVGGTHVAMIGWHAGSLVTSRSSRFAVMHFQDTAMGIADAIDRTAIARMVTKVEPGSTHGL